jgi:hypothetical protein
MTYQSSATPTTLEPFLQPLPPSDQKGVYRGDETARFNLLLFDSLRGKSLILSKEEQEDIADEIILTFR